MKNNTNKKLNQIDAFSESSRSLHLATSSHYQTNDPSKVAINIPSVECTALSRISLKKNQTVSSDLSNKLIGDVLVALGVTFGMSPFVSIVDKAVVQRAAGTHSILQSGLESLSTIIRNPIAYVKSPTFLMMWTVYAATYTTANCSKTVFEHHTQDQEPGECNKEDSRGKLGIFLSTTVVNSSFSMLKDKFYAVHFGVPSAPPRIPMITYGLWGARDLITIGSSFILPDIVSNVLEKEVKLDRNSALLISQLACPIGMQLIISPIQMLALDFYNRPMKTTSWNEAVMKRYAFVRSHYASIVTARVARIAPAFGIGGIGNTYFRDLWRSMLLRRDVESVNLARM